MAALSRLWPGVMLLLLSPGFMTSAGAGSLPKRLIIALDGIAYRDVVALQEAGCFQGWFPASRMVSTFPSASDIAWTEVFGNRALPGYQRTYYNAVANRKVFVNALTSSLDFEKQATWRLHSPFRFAMSYIRPVKEFRHEVDQMVRDFLATGSAEENYYAIIVSTDSAQHMGADILSMLRSLDERLRALGAIYKAREGRDLEILILSDHGNNHAGRGRRVDVKKFLRRAGYRISRSILGPKDVVLPTVGIQSWVEIHNAPSETERLMELLCRLEGVGVLTGRLPGCGDDDEFLVMDSQGRGAKIEWRRSETKRAATSQEGSFRYTPLAGDPLEYLPVIENLRHKKQLDENGFATAAAWMGETLSHRYPVALERIARGHTRVVLNPATILISLENGHVHAGWLVDCGSKLMKAGGTHGALDDLNSTGVVLSNFAPTRDTTANRVAGLYGGFPGLRDPLEGAEGAELASGRGQALTPVSRGSIDWSAQRLPGDEIFLHVWSPRFASAKWKRAIELTVTQMETFPSAKLRRSDPEPPKMAEERFVLSQPLLQSGASEERLYALPAGLLLKPGKQYRISGWIEKRSSSRDQIFEFTFFSDAHGRPVPYLKK